jgi:hypothetical protein
MSAQNGNQKWGNRIASLLVLAIFGYILIRASIEFYAIAWGTGVWLGEFSLKWSVGFFVFVLFGILSWVIAGFILWKRDTLTKWTKHIIAFREKLGPFRWLVALALLVFPVWFLQYTPWGIVFGGLYVRLFLWIYIAFGIAIFLQGGERLLKWSGLLAALLLTSSAFSIAVALINVSDYPFSLGWSEGNRMWDYSMMFGRHLYDYPVDQKVYVLLDTGRQFIGGVPFLIPGLSIQAERFWVGLTTIIPYLMLGFAAFRSDFKDKKLWILLAFWTFIFLKQGPIHPPLVICAFVVALLWRGPLWLGIPLIFATSYFAEESRFTWLFAPAIWIVMLEFSGALLEKGRLQKSTWWRAGTLGLSGAIGGYFGSSLAAWLRTLLAHGETAPLAGGAVSVSSVTSSVSAQPLLWYRLFPNATNGTGILLALLIAVAPTLALLIYLSVIKKWVLNIWQKLAILLPFSAFLLVGLVVSTKIGGGGDLHNLDMFLIGIVFTAVIAWENGGRQWLGKFDTHPVWVQGVLILLLVIPGIQPLSALRSFQFTDQLPWLVTLTDVSKGKFLELLPAQDEVDDILQTIRREVDARKSQGEILFLDQRQLLTFGYVKDVPFVPEYEKKVLMNEAMSESADYFAPFYADLAAHRFSLIISEPLRAPVKDSNYEFGEENNAWVKWVVEPVLCYYEEIETFKSAQIQLLVPKPDNVDCSSRLPVAPVPRTGVGN